MSLLELSFPIMAVVVLFIAYLGSGKQLTGMIVLGLWGIVACMIASTGFLEESDGFPPRVAVILLPTIVWLIVMIRRTRPDQMKLSFLTGIHLIRIPVEIGLLMLFRQTLIPEVMTFEGWNFDIVMGITAIPMLWIFLQRATLPIKLLRAWNLLGIILLTIIVITAILSAPGPQQLINFDQPNVAILRVPFILLPSVIVPVVYYAHFVALKRLNSLS